MMDVRELNIHIEFHGCTEQQLIDGTGDNKTDYMYHFLNVELFRAFQKKYTDIKINPIANWGKTCSECKYGTGTITIENPSNGKYFIISYLDNNASVGTHNGWDLENCMGFFPHVGIQQDNLSYKKHPHINYIPNTILSYYKSGHDIIETLYKHSKKSPEKPLFRGTPYLFRRWVYNNDKRFNFISTEHGQNRLSPVDFMSELAQNAINIDLNSVAEISCRTVECLGLQTALIRPELTIQYHDRLIPDYHYAKVECDDLSNYKLLADAYIDKFEQLKHNPELVHYLSTNGRKWYEENATLTSAVKLYLKIVDLYKLF